ncbi:D-lactate dehydrogenase [Sphingomonas sp. DG1-23]|uniref:D-lactate dehydrogenase n=1 Tax=Sphingomonas sp. DG1-23 TaxID=3068316 RepID=UPI00273E4433|nr:D-lactate dehydrogenase [Sphingomonas sp. DG1-23]MDP5279819.1 D-lactate dehydrogenase [Sphingomonas sp. DG1-23]
MSPSSVSSPVSLLSRPEFLAGLRRIVGRARVLTDPAKTRPFRTGYRFGEGAALAVVRPRTLVEMWRVLEACVAADKIVILQAANTGLTGGSTPAGDDYDRDIVIISPVAVSGVHLIDAGRQVVCLPGTTLFELEAALTPLGREPHSVIGSSCIGASVIGGICNNSGGALIRRGPAFTELALYAQRGEDGALRLVNHLGIHLEGSPEQMLEQLERGSFDEADIDMDPTRRASDRDYARRVREIDSEVPARFNADPQCLFEGSGSAGKLALFAVRLDTFPKDDDTRVFYIGTNDPDELTRIRRHILGSFENLPVAGEYMHRDCFDIAERYGKDSFLAVQILGTDRLPMLYAVKAKVDALAARLGIAGDASDRILQALSRVFPDHLPRRMKHFRDRFEHHLIVRMAGAGIKEAAGYFGTIFPTADGDFFTCTTEEGEKAFLHRFAAAGAAVRYRTIHADATGGIIALDIALPRNERNWVEALSPEIAEDVVHALYYGHFFCHVFHHDYVVRKGADPAAIERAMWQLLDTRGAEYPAEHNVGHLYKAKPALAEFYRALDPANGFNPGIGQTSKRAWWR